MKKLTKRLIAIFSAAVVVAAVSSFAVSATDINEIVLTEVPTDNSGTEITPRYNIGTVTALGTSGFDYIGGDNNVFAVELNITNAATNPGNIVIRITDEDGKIIVNSGTVKVGESYSFSIPANSGQYSVYAKTSTVAGTYTIDLNDGWGR